MKIKGLEVSLLTEADRSDPANYLVTAAARAEVDGVPCGWKGTAISAGIDRQAALELAVGHLIKQILTKPKNAVVIGQVPPPPSVVFTVPDVLIEEYELGK
jgi:hypothetical protein